MSPALSNLLMVIGLWLALALLCCGGSRLREPGQQRQQTPNIIVTASDLMGDYEANEVAADQKYKGKIVRVSGVVDSIGKDILDSMYISLDSGQEYSIRSVQCFFDDAAQGQLANLRKGLTVTVTCRCDGMFGNVLLKDCTLNAVRRSD